MAELPVRSPFFYADVERCLSIFMNFILSCFLFRTTCDENVLESGSASPARRPLLAALTFTGKRLSHIKSIYLSNCFVSAVCAQQILAVIMCLNGSSFNKSLEKLVEAGGRIL